MRSRLRFVFIVLFLCFLFYGVSVYGDYDISSNYRKTEFNTTKWLNTTHNVIINTISGEVYLNESVNNFLIWNENDPNNRLSQTQYSSIFTDLQINDDNTYCYIDKTNELQDFKARFRLNITDMEISTGNSIRIHPFIVTDKLDDYYDNYLNDETQFGLQIRNINNDMYWWYLQEIDAGAPTYVFGCYLNVSKEYYFKIVKIGTFFKIGCYRDNEYNDLIIEVNKTLNHNYNLPYLLIPQSAHISDTFKISGYIKNLRIGEFYNDGVLYTRNLLENSTEKSVMVGINSTAVSDTRVQLYGSPDNSTWKLLIDNNGLGELRQYSEILNNYSSLYVRLNLTTIDPLVTPFVDELFYLHTYECVAGSETKPYVFIILFTIIGMLLGYVIDRT